MILHIEPFYSDPDSAGEIQAVTSPESPPDVPVAPKLRLSLMMWPMIELVPPLSLNLTLHSSLVFPGKLVTLLVIEKMTRVLKVRTVDPLTVSLCQSQGALPRQPPVGGRF